MALFSFKKKVVNPADSGEVSKGKRTIKRSPPVAMEVKLLALEGLAAGGIEPHIRITGQELTLYCAEIVTVFCGAIAHGDTPPLTSCTSNPFRFSGTAKRLDNIVPM